MASGRFICLSWKRFHPVFFLQKAGNAGKERGGSSLVHSYELGVVLIKIKDPGIASYSIFGLPSGRFIYIIDTETSILRRKSNGGKATNEKKWSFFV